MIVIVGAGMAGLVAARLLHDTGEEVVVVEGRDRIGGRTHTVDVGGVPVDLGASWIHNGASSPMLGYVESLGIDRMPAAPSEIVLGAAVLDRTAGRYADGEDRMALSIGMASLFMNAAAAAALPDDLDVAKGIDALLPECPPAARHSVGALLAMNEGADPDELRFANYAAFLSGEGKDTDVWPEGGYRRVTAALADGLDIRLVTTVTRIEHDLDGVRVQTATEVFAADHVLVTIPLGVLKAGSVTFDPPLPASHQEAIGRVGFGAFEKVAIAYDTPVWQRDGGPTHITAADGQPVEFVVILDASRWYGAPVLIGMAVGDSARALAGMSDDEKVSALHDVVVAIAGDDAPTPKAAAVTSWTNDPFLLGCYTRMTAATDVATQAADVATLATPVGRVGFAGEHTNVSGTSTVDSAWLSGLREASRLLGREVTL